RSCSLALLKGTLSGPSKVGVGVAIRAGMPQFSVETNFGQTTDRSVTDMKRNTQPPRSRPLKRALACCLLALVQQHPAPRPMSKTNASGDFFMANLVNRVF